MEASTELTLESLVTHSQDVEPYVMDWPVIADDDEPEAAILVVSKRPGGFLAAVPTGLVPEEVLAAGNELNPPGVVGPSTGLVVPGVMFEQGQLVAADSSLPVVVVDLGTGRWRIFVPPGSPRITPFPTMQSSLLFFQLLKNY